MAQETNQSQAPLLCTTGCGFYSNPRNNGMCSVCYKDFLQRQNNNGRVSPPAASSAVAVCSLGESLLAQCSESSTVDVPSATAHADSGTTSSVVSSQSLSTPPNHSDEESTATSEAGLKTEDIQERAPFSTAIGGRQQSSSADSSGPRFDAQASQPMRDQDSMDRNAAKRPSPGYSSHKRKLEEADEEKASVSVSEDSDQASVDGQDRPTESDKPKVLKKNRCFACRKKVGLTGFDCRCGNVFCGAHRYSDIHNCTFDYKADAAEKIRKANPVVVGEKIQKI
ncbi:AN1-type zinc finger protein 6 [Esox lucius]|uniref:AN1-type zinc finger protein 6 n=1 Tax=Esox lucius TaxID=8010 RepID=A0A3P8ZAC3_ESOLU|nr:AN1-type zinc finger protein 6 [Esox lucius]XP_019909170.1 AN1-type zinc finger protein 6 [Esox lucius]XP_019909173.1 AN1-type zinc finger protein 6 [Esox lucius]XP_019909176.1 AN1-type zinc finger protein 6 [Esox lucius]XP_019909183.1 AN1-type zinc finger protein 6 [Esox lucius]